MKKTISLTLILALCMVTKVAKADFTFGVPTNLGPPISTPYNDIPSYTTLDGLEITSVTTTCQEGMEVGIYGYPRNKHQNKYQRVIGVNHRILEHRLILGRLKMIHLSQPMVWNSTSTHIIGLMAMVIGIYG